MIDKYKLISRLIFGFLWLTMCWAGVTEHVMPGLSATGTTVLNFLADALLLVLGIMLMRSWRDMAVMGFFVIVLVGSKLLNGQDMVTMLNGAREYIPLITCGPIIRWLMNNRHAREFTESLDRQLYWLLWLQAAFITMQYVVFGGWDLAGGTLGNGFSGAASTYIYVVSFYLTMKRWDFSQSWSKNIYNCRVYIFLLYPSFLNETKVSLIYILLFFVLLYPINKIYVLRLVKLAPAILVLGVGAIYAYGQLNSDSEYNVLDADFMNEYLFGDDRDQLVELALAIQEEDFVTDELWAMDLPRFAKISLAPEALETTKGGLWWGAGAGQFRAATHSKFNQAYAWLLQGTVLMLFEVLIDLGVMGCIWLIFTLTVILATPNKEPWGKNVRIFMTAIFFLSMLYDYELSIQPLVFIYFYIAMAGLQPGPEKKQLKS